MHMHVTYVYPTILAELYTFRQERSAKVLGQLHLNFEGYS
jgi:hypothetical protein